MEESKPDNGYLDELSKPNPIQKKTAVLPKSLFPLLPLPTFKFSEEEVSLATSFSVKEQKDQHMIRQTTLSNLFKDPVYMANKKYDQSASNLKFACLKALYTQSEVQTIETTLSEQQNLSLIFQSRFQSGNLAFAQKSQSNDQYFLLLQKDINTTRCTQWFFFRVHNRNFRGKVRFHIINFLKNYSSFQNGMKISVCSQNNDYCWTRSGQNITYIKNNIKIANDKYYYSLSFTYDFTQNDVTYFAHSPPYTYSMLDNYLLNLCNDSQNEMLLKRRTLTQSPGGNYVDLLSITNFKSSSKSNKKTVFITSRVHPGETPSSFVCQGIINYLLSNTDETKRLRQHFVFKIVPMLNPDGVINGNYRCSLSGYDLNRVWHYDNKQSSPQIYFTKRAILDQQNCFLFIDLHAHSKKKGVFMYGCQNRASPFISRHIPYLLWKQITPFNYFQCNFGMRLGRQGTSRLTVHRMMKMPYSYTMEHSFCSPIKEKYHFTVKHYKEIGAGICSTLKKYFCCRQPSEEAFKQLYANKDLMKVGCGEDAQSSDDSDLEDPTEFNKKLQTRTIVKRKLSTTFRSKIIDPSNTSTSKFVNKIHVRELSPRKTGFPEASLSKGMNMITKKLISLIPQVVDLKVPQQIEMNGEQVFLSARVSQQQNRSLSPQKIDQQMFLLSSTSRYQFQEMQSLNNLFLPSLTSASYKRYSKKKNYNKQFIQVGKKYLQANNILKEQIRSVSRRKVGWKQQILSYI